MALGTGENILNVMLCNKGNYASPIIFRLGIPYGNELNTAEGYGFVNLFCSLAMRHNEFEVPFLSDVKRTLTYIGDMCDAAAITENAILPLIVNIPGEILTIGEIASAISKHYGVSFKNKGCFSPDDYCFDAGASSCPINILMRMLSILEKYHLQTGFQRKRQQIESSHEVPQFLFSFFDGIA